MHRMLLVVGVLLLPGLARADSPKIEVDFRVGYGGSVDRQQADDLNIRSALDGGFGEIELRWMPKRLRTAARRAGRVGLRIQLGAGAGLTRSREITWCDDGFIGVTRESQLLGRGRGVRLGIGIGPVFRVQPRVAFGPLVQFNVHHVEGGAWEIDDRDNAARSDSPYRFGVSFGLGLTLGKEARVGLGMHAGSSGRGAMLVGWQLTIGFGVSSRAGE